MGEYYGENTAQLASNPKYVWEGHKHTGPEPYVPRLYEKPELPVLKVRRNTFIRDIVRAQTTGFIRQHPQFIVMIED